MANFKDLVGKVLINIERSGEYGEEILIFICDDGSKYKMYHEEDCSESVHIEDINGDLKDLINSEILVADEKINVEEDSDGTSTWTFYTIRTQKGSVDIRWFGSSNGYYSENVDFIKADKNGNYEY